MIRVLQIVSSMDRGGLETFIMNIYRNIDRTKVQFDFLVHTDKKCAYDEEIRTLGGKIYNIPARNQGIIKNKRALDNFFSFHREYRVVHQHVSSLSYVKPLKAAKRYKVPVRIVHAHSTKQGGSFIHKYIHRFNQLSVKSYATHYFACSDLVAKWVYGKKQYNAGEFTIIKNGIETKNFLFNEHVRKEKRKELGIEDKFVLGHVGRFAYPKNHNFLIDIFKAVHEKETNSVLLLVGDGKLRGQIEKKIENLGLKSNFILMGVRSDISDLLQAMDVFVMPSHYEGLPVTLVEAQAAGLPCVVSSNITKQIKITDFIEYIDLSCTVSLWRKSILQLVANHIRKNTKQQIINAGYDIKRIANYLQEVYVSFKKTSRNTHYGE